MDNGEITPKLITATLVPEVMIAISHCGRVVDGSEVAVIWSSIWRVGKPPYSPAKRVVRIQTRIFKLGIFYLERDLTKAATGSPSHCVKVMTLGNPISGPLAKFVSMLVVNPGNSLATSCQLRPRFRRSNSRAS